MSVNLVTITAPTTEPVTTAEAKAHLRVGHTSDDTYIASLVTAARLVVEARSGMKLFTQTIELRADSFADAGLAYPGNGDVIVLRTAPIASITSIKYYSSSDVDTTVTSTDYWEDLTSVPARVQIKTSWPTPNDRIGTVRIRMVAGWTTVALIPEIFKVAIKLLVGHYYENREEVTDVKLSEIPEGINSILMNNPEYHHYSTGSI